jgi:hypothetical protein
MARHELGAEAATITNGCARRANQKTSPLSSRPSHAKRGAEPGSIATELARGCGVWVPALASLGRDDRESL